MELLAVRAEEVASVTIGTTSFINALLQRRGLARVAIVRLAGPGSEAVPPLCDFPADLREHVEGMWRIVPGGYEYNGNEAAPLDEGFLRQACRDAKALGLHVFALSCAFATLKSDMEKRAADIIREEVPNVMLTISSDLHQMNLLQRENATILNSCLLPLARKTVSAFASALASLNLTCPLLISQNDGTVSTVESAVSWPVLSVGSGPTNSMRGAALLTGLKTPAIVMDIGGTTTDVGVIEHGFPRMAGARITIGGVQTNFRMPDTYSIPLGGGSIVHAGEHLAIGPISVGHELVNKALIFGGDVLTTTDIAVAVGLATGVGDVTKVKHLDKAFLDHCLRNIMEKLAGTVDTVKTTKDPLPLVLVGGGNIIVSSTVAGTSETLRPQHASSANAVGAAFPQVSGGVDCYTSFTAETREATIKKYIEEAKAHTVTAGADPKTLEVVELSEYPQPYMTEGSVMRLKIKVVGDLGASLAARAHPVHPPKLLLDVPEDISCAKKEEHPAQGTLSCSVSQPVAVRDGTGWWVETEDDFVDIAVGAGVVGTGGGGSTIVPLLKGKALMQRGLRAHVVDLDTEVPDNGIIAVVGYMGDPTVLSERFMATALENALRAVEHEAGVAATHLLCLEAAGSNCLEPLNLSMTTGLPVVDADGMGRAFPKLQMILPFILAERYEHSPTPAAMSLDSGKTIVFRESPSAAALEDDMRKQVVQVGCAAGVCLGLLTKKEACGTLVRNSVSNSRNLGHAIRSAVKTKTDPVAAACKAGALLFVGKIVGVARKQVLGFAVGKITVDGLGQSYTNRTVKITYQNENLLVKEKKEVLSTVPDLICILDTDTGSPIFTEELKYGLRVSVIVLPCFHLYRTDKALDVAGPRGFGFTCEPKLLA
eukprot:TRINITY_DN698_c0_g1_i4.p1 TRINITY_DN698_c0_g1~~TRINITY_DN698_c0_g1_i4.p1  ORF type:complete len:936 (+),score=202.97 TRINITY_DN698_c0_g1_i4:164-2809(+)